MPPIFAFLVLNRAVIQNSIKWKNPSAARNMAGCQYPNLVPHAIHKPPAVAPPNNPARSAIPSNANWWLG